MIVWGQPTVVPFQFTESSSFISSSSASGSASFRIETGFNYNYGSGFVGVQITNTYEESSSFTYTSLSSNFFSRTVNESGTTEEGSFLASSLSAFFSSFANTDGTTYTRPIGVPTTENGSTFFTSTETTSGVEPTFASGETNTSESTSTSNSASFSTEAAPRDVFTTTTSTEEEVITVTNEGTTQYFVLTTTGADGGDWTTAASSNETTSPVVAQEEEDDDEPAQATREKTVTVLTITDTVIANTSNTIYEAFPDEVLYVAGSVPLDGYGGVGRTAQTATRTTLSGEFANIPYVIVDGTDLNVPLQSATNESFSSSISWSRTSLVSSEVTGATLSALPHSTTTLTVFRPVTTSTSASFSRAEQIVAHAGDTITIQSAYPVSKTVERFGAGLFSTIYQTTYADSSVSTATVKFGPVFLTSSASSEQSGPSSASGSSSENGGGGNSTYEKQSLYLGVRPPAFSAAWSVYGQRGVEADGQTGLVYTITDNISFVEQVKVNRSLGGLITIKPATNETYTADRLGVTWKTESGSTEITSSAAIEASALADSSVLFGNQRQGLLGGNLAVNETAVQFVSRGVYVDQGGNTTFFEGNENSYVGDKATTYYKPKWWIGNGGQRVVAVARNSTALEDFFPFEP